MQMNAGYQYDGHVPQNIEPPPQYEVPGQPYPVDVSGGQPVHSGAPGMQQYPMPGQYQPGQPNPQAQQGAVLQQAGYPMPPPAQQGVYVIAQPVNTQPNVIVTEKKVIKQSNDAAACACLAGVCAVLLCCCLAGGR